MALTLEQLKEGAVAAYKQGNQDAARRFAAAAKREEERLSQQPQLDEGMAKFYEREGLNKQVSPETVIPEQGPTMTEQALGAGEAALSVATGATGGMLGSLAGTLQGIAQQVAAGKFGTSEGAQAIADSAAAGGEALTYAPRTEAGQEALETVADVTAPLAALPPVGAGAQAVTTMARRATDLTPAVQANTMSKAAPAVTKVKELTAAPVQAVKNLISPEAEAPGSVGAASVGMATRRIQDAESLPVPIKLTKGDASRDLKLQKEESELAKMDEVGAPLRQRRDQQNAALAQNLEAFIDSSGATLSEDLVGIGEAATSALRNKKAKAKSKVRTLYKEADKSGELDAVADINPLATFLNDNRASRVEDGLLTKVQRKIDAMEVGQGSFADGTLALKPMTLRQTEDIRKFINGEADWKDDRDVALAAQMRRLIDDSTESVGGEKIKAARAARREMAEQFEDVSLIRDLIGTKRGSQDRAIALEDVLNRAVLRPSASQESLQFLKKMLTSDDDTGEGAQAWKEIQGGSLAYIRDKALRGAGTTTTGDKVFSAAGLEAALTPLIKSGKLDILFDKKTANGLMVLNDVAKVVKTQVEGAVNRSNTASALTTIADLVLAGSSGLPVPVTATAKAFFSALKDKKLKKRVEDLLDAKL